MAHHQPILNPELPYVGEVEGGLTSGKMVKVQGRVPADSTSFAINYQLGPGLNPRDDIALHVSPKFKEGIIVRNHIQSMTWGPDESDGPMWLQRGAPFEIIIFCEYQCYKIAINGRHFAEFAHRLPYSKVTHLVIDGEVEIASISYENVSILKPSAPIPDDPIDVAPPGPGGLYPKLNRQEKSRPTPDVNDSRYERDHIYQSKPQKSDEKELSGLDKVGLAVGGLMAAGSVAAAMHAYKKNKKKYEAEGDYQKVKPPKSPIGVGGLGTLGAALATSLASNAFQRDMKTHAQQGYPSSDARSDVFSSIFGALGGAGGRQGGSQFNYMQPPQPNLFGEALGGVLGGGRRQQPQYPPAGAYGGYPQARDSREDNGSDFSNGLGGVLFKSALDGLSSHVSQKVEKKLAKELTKGLNKSLNLTPRKA